MDKSMIVGIAVGAVAATAIAGVAGYRALNGASDYAEVVHSEPVMKTVKTPREVCNDVAVTEPAPVRDQNRIAGTAIGAVVGGVLGNQIGGGDGKKLATVGGAVAGGYAGNQIQRNMQDNNTHTTRETRCRTVYDSHEAISGYKVTYRIGDPQGVVHMDRDPGARIPLRDGQLDLGSQPG